MGAARRLGLAVLFATSASFAQQPGAPPPASPASAPPAPPASAPPAAPGPAAAAPVASAPPPYAYPYPPYPYPYPYPYAPAPPAELPYVEGERVPDGYHTESRVRRGPIIAGATLGGSTYLINLLVASIAQRSDEDQGRVTLLYIPGIGTWGYVGDACDSNGDDGCSFLILHSAAHTAGVALFVYGFAAPRTVLSRNDVSLTLAPSIARSGSGLSLLGSF